MTVNELKEHCEEILRRNPTEHQKEEHTLVLFLIKQYYILLFLIKQYYILLTDSANKKEKTILTVIER